MNVTKSNKIGKIDIFISNAGIYIEGGLNETETQSMDRRAVGNARAVRDLRAPRAGTEAGRARLPVVADRRARRIRILERADQGVRGEIPERQGEEEPGAVPRRACQLA